MALITWRQLLDHAAEREYEYGAPDFDFNDLEQVRAIVEEVAVFDAALRAVQAVRSTYPPRKADALAGRLENLVTGQQQEFASGQELIDSTTRDLEVSGTERSVDARSE